MFFKYKSQISFLSIISYISIFFLFSANILGQLNYPYQYHQYYQNISQFNPAGSGIYAPLEVHLGNNFYLSYLKAQYSYFNGNYRFISKKSGSNLSNTLGIRFFGYNEGKYIRGSRFYLNYSFHSKLYSQINFSGGIDFGVINSNIKGTPSTGHFSEYILDGNAGVILYGKKFHVGIAANQLLNNKLQPIQEIIKLYRHLIFSSSYRFVLYDNFQITPFGKICIPYFNRSLIDVGAKFLYSNHYLIAINYRKDEAISFLIGIQRFKLANGLINGSISYNTPSRTQAFNISTMEIIITFFQGINNDNEGYFFKF